MLPYYKVLKFIFRYVLPDWSRYPLARIIARGVCLFNAKRRNVIVGNLTPLVGPEKAREMAPELLGNFLMTAVDFFCPRQNIARTTPIENLHYLERVYRQTKRVMAVTAHVGHWELSIACLEEKRYALAGVYAPYRADDIVRWIMGHRNQDVEWIPAVRGASDACESALAKGRIVGMVADIPFGEKGRRVNLAGHTAHLPLGPWAIAVRARAAVVPGFVIRQSPGQYRVIIHQPIVPPGGSFRKQVEQMQEEFKRHLEYYLRTYPTQWGVLQPFWDKTPAASG